MRPILLLALLFTGCATHQPPVQQQTPATPRVFIPSGVPDSVVVCVALPTQWSCRTVGELRQMFSVQARL